jgi:predicted RNA-binding protein
MDNTTFFKYININYNGENLTFDMETLKPVKYTNMRNLRNNKLEFISNETKINMTELFEDKLVFKNQYSKIKLRKYKINFDGKSRIIELKNGYKFKLSFDLNCADHRNEIKILEANYNDSCGALINEDVKNSIKYFIPKN